MRRTGYKMTTEKIGQYAARPVLRPLTPAELAAADFGPREDYAEREDYRSDHEITADEVGIPCHGAF